MSALSLHFQSVRRHHQQYESRIVTAYGISAVEQAPDWYGTPRFKAPEGTPKITDPQAMMTSALAVATVLNLARMELAGDLTVQAADHLAKLAFDLRDDCFFNVIGDGDIEGRAFHDVILDTVDTAVAKLKKQATRGHRTLPDMRFGNKAA